MLDFLRNLTRSAEEKRQEELNAYLDGELRGREREQFEALLASDPALHAEVAQLRATKEQVAQLPRLRAPRNYTLDPARYGAPAPGGGLSLYPALRLATVLTAFLLMLAVGIEFLPRPAGAPVAEDSIALVATTEVEEPAAERVEAPQEAAPESAREAGLSEMTEVAGAEEEADDGELFSLETAETEVMTEEVGISALPAPAADAVEETAQDTLAEEEPLNLATAAPPEAEGETAAAPELTAPTDQPAPVNAPLRLTQVALGALLLVLLTATLLLRRRLA